MHCKKFKLGKAFRLEGFSRSVVPEDGADVRAVVVAMVQRLDQQDTDVDPPRSFRPFGDDGLAASGASSHRNELVPAGCCLLPEDANARELVTSWEPALIAA